jgi:eukaryotic-like serine/threonine-protein kinase
MKRCRKCNREYEDQIGYCSYDGQPLPDVNLIDGKYRLEKKIGEGGMGQVYAATHIHLKVTFALKILHASFVNNDQAVERFRREAEAAANIKHPNAISVTDFGVDKENNVVYFVMEYLEGVTLRHYFHRNARLQFNEIYIILAQVCAALQAAHDKGIIHRDLKPDNIFLVKDNNADSAAGNIFDYRVKVLDFGLAKLMHYENVHLTAEGKIIGTLNYMSPEQVMSLNVAATTDIYSLGVILYEMITGVRPYKVKDHFELIMRQLTDHIKPLRELRPEVLPELEAVVLRALNRDAGLRQQSMLGLLKEYENCLRAANIPIPRLNDGAGQKAKRRSSIMNDIWNRLADEPAVPTNNTPFEQSVTEMDEATRTVDSDQILTGQKNKKAN